MHCANGQNPLPFFEDHNQVIMHYTPRHDLNEDGSDQFFGFDRLMDSQGDALWLPGERPNGLNTGGEMVDATLQKALRARASVL